MTADQKERVQRKKVSINSRLIPIQIIVQRKVFCKQRIPEPSCAMKETVDIYVLITSMNGDIKRMQTIRITSGPAT